MTLNKLLVVLSLIAYPIFAQTPLSARDAVFKALENNFQVQISEKQLEIAEKNNTWGGAGAFPSVTLTVGNNNVVQDNTNNPLTFTPGIIMSNSISPTLGANWNIFTGFAVRISKTRLEQLEEQSANNAFAVIESTTQDVLKAYYTAQLQKEQLNLFNEMAGQSRELKQYYELREKYSTANSLEIMQFRNQYLSDSMNVLLQEISLDNAMRNLKLLMNDTSEVVYELIDPIDIELRLIDKNEMQQALLENNTNLKNQLINMELQRSNTNFQRSFLYPTLSLQAGTNPSWSWIRLLKDDPSIPFNEISTSNILYYGNFNLRYSIYDNWKNKRAVEVARIQEEISTLNYEQNKQSLSNALDNLIELYEMRTQLLSVSTENVNYAEKAFDIARSRYDLGTLNSIDLANFQMNYRNAVLRHYENVFNRLDTYLELYRLSGKIALDYTQE
jgi:outer membrane protein